MLSIVKIVVAEQVLNDKLPTTALSFTKKFAEVEVEKISKQQTMKEKFVIVFGKGQEYDTWLARSKRPPRPTLITEGDTQVWVINLPTHHVLVVSVPGQDDKALFSLATVAKHLPLLTRYAGANFENGKTKLRGTCSVESPDTLNKDNSG